MPTRRRADCEGRTSGTAWGLKPGSLERAGGRNGWLRGPRCFTPQRVASLRRHITQAYSFSVDSIITFGPIQSELHVSGIVFKEKHRCHDKNKLSLRGFALSTNPSHFRGSWGMKSLSNNWIKGIQPSLGVASVLGVMKPLCGWGVEQIRSQGESGSQGLSQDGASGWFPCGFPLEQCNKGTKKRHTQLASEG